MTATVHNIRPLPRGVAPVNATQLRTVVAVQRAESRRRKDIQEHRATCCEKCGGVILPTSKCVWSTDLKRFWHPSCC